MREILFRGKTSLGEWVHGDLTTEKKEPNKSYIWHSVEGKPGWKGYVPNESFAEVDPETVCQYTGLTDKDGRKIFEGDIVKLPKCENDVAVVALRGCNYFFKGKCGNYDYAFGSCDSECFEIIGNIFDNPDLIGDQP